MNVSDEVVLGVSGQEDSQPIYYNWYLDNTFQNKVRASDLSEILYTHTKKKKVHKALWPQRNILSSGCLENTSEDRDRGVPGLGGL